MAEMYAHYIVIGFGKSSCDCLKTILQYSRRVTAIESEYNQLSTLEAASKRNGVEYMRATGKEAITDYLSGLKEKTLVISANNKYIFPRKVVANQYLTIVNFHNSLLPYYRGVNCPSWIIYDRKEISGVTWHFVNENIDDGKIIIQKFINLKGDETALDLTRKCIYLGTESFNEIVEDLVNEKISGSPQEKSSLERMCYARDIPNDGRINFSDSFDKIYAVLRSVDYGKLQFFPPLNVNILNNEYFVDSYKLSFFDDSGVSLSISNQKITIGNEGRKLEMEIKII